MLEYLTIASYAPPAPMPVPTTFQPQGWSRSERFQSPWPGSFGIHFAQSRSVRSPAVWASPRRPEWYTAKRPPY